MNEKFIEYTESSLRSIPYDDILYSFERQIADSAAATERCMTKILFLICLSANIPICPKNTRSFAARSLSAAANAACTCFL